MVLTRDPDVQEDGLTNYDYVVNIWNGDGKHLKTTNSWWATKKYWEEQMWRKYGRDWKKNLERQKTGEGDKVIWHVTEEIGRERAQGWKQDFDKQKLYEDGVPIKEEKANPFAIDLARVTAKDPEPVFVPGPYSDFSESEDEDQDKSEDEDEEERGDVDSKQTSLTKRPAWALSTFDDEREDEDEHPTKESILRFINKADPSILDPCVSNVANVGSGRKNAISMGSMLFLTLIKEYQTPVGAERILEWVEWGEQLRPGMVKV